MEQLTDDERAYNQRVMAQVNDANAVVGSWMRHLYEKYGLAPGRDRVHPDGRIERIPPGPPGQNGSAGIQEQMRAQAASRIAGEV